MKFLRSLSLNQAQFELCRQHCWDDAYCNAFAINRHERGFLLNGEVNVDIQNRCILYNYCDDMQIVDADSDAMYHGESSVIDDFGVWLLYCDWGKVPDQGSKLLVRTV